MKNYLFIIFMIFTSINTGASDYKCELQQEGLCIRYSGEETDDHFQEIKNICKQNNGQMELGFCSKNQVIGRCIFMNEIITYYYSYKFNDYDAETTCNYSYGKYRKGYSSIP